MPFLWLSAAFSMPVTSLLKSIQTSRTLFFHFNPSPASEGKSHGSLSLCPGSSSCGTGCLFLWCRNGLHIARDSPCPGESIPLPASWQAFFMEDRAFILTPRSLSLSVDPQAVPFWLTLGALIKFISLFSSCQSGPPIYSCPEWLSFLIIIYLYLQQQVITWIN